MYTLEHGINIQGCQLNRKQNKECAFLFHQHGMYTLEHGINIQGFQLNRKQKIPSHQKLKQPEKTTSFVIFYNWIIKNFAFNKNNSNCQKYEMITFIVETYLIIKMHYMTFYHGGIMIVGYFFKKICIGLEQFLHSLFCHHLIF